MGFWVTRERATLRTPNRRSTVIGKLVTFSSSREFSRLLYSAGGPQLTDGDEPFRPKVRDVTGSAFLCDRCRFCRCGVASMHSDLVTPRHKTSSSCSGEYVFAVF